MDTTVRLIDLTVGEFQAIIGREVERRIAALAQASGKNQEQHETDGPLYGLKGIAEALHCSKAQAAKMKSEGLLEGGYQQIGRNIVVRSAQALRDIAERSTNKRTQKHPKITRR